MAAPEAEKGRVKARVGVVGAGWWSQGWHIPHMSVHPDVELVGIVDRSPNPSNPLNPDLEPLEALSKKYGCPVFSSLADLLKLPLDGIIVGTPHGTHAAIGAEIIEHSLANIQNGAAPIKILMEKPMTTDVKEALTLHALVQKHDPAGFFVNNTANWRHECKLAADAVKAGRIGDVKQVSCFLGAPLVTLFDNPVQKAWNEPSGNMIGNGFGWGQTSHLLGWVFAVSGLTPKKVFCAMSHSSNTGADVFDSATIVCNGNASISLSATGWMPGADFGTAKEGEKPTGKLIDIKIFGSEGSLMYGGDDTEPTSGKLVMKQMDGTITHLSEQFTFESGGTKQEGPESVLNFVKACLGQDFHNGANSDVGLRAVQAIEAMYRSAKSGEAENVVSA